MLQSAGLDFVIRSNHDRKINAPSGESLKVHIQSQACADNYVLEVKGSNPQRRKRMAQMELRYDRISLCCPANAVLSEKYPSELEVTLFMSKRRPKVFLPAKSR